MKENKNKELLDSFIKGIKPVDIDKFKKQYNVKEHEIFTNIVKYPDRKVISISKDKDGNEQTSTSIVPINRVGLPFQKRIVDLAVMFQTAISYQYQSIIDDYNKDLFESFNKIISSNKLEFSDRLIATECKKYTEVAELWYVKECEEKDRYGFKSKFKLKHKILSRDYHKLYPKFDRTGDLIAFTIESKNENNSVYETYQSDRIYKFNKDDSGIKVEEKANIIGKIPIVFYSQEQTEWEDVQHLIEIAESQRSGFSESNKKFGEPILKLKGEVQGSSESKGGGRVIQVKDGGDASFLVPPNANDNFNHELKLNRRDIHEFTNTPDLSEEFYSGKGNVLSGIGRALVWLPAHLKVKRNEEIFIPALKRRISIILSFLREMNVKYKNQELEIDPVITPFNIDDDKEIIETLLEANGNQPLMSQEESIRRYGIEKAEEEIVKIKKESLSDLSESFE